jgi:UDP-GlcNAc:undecaprenyl-phosphate GlcNAc-1-phosphate transferase
MFIVISPSMRPLVATIIAMLLTIVTTPPLKRMALRLGVTAPPSDDGRHSEATPLLGGVAIVISILIALAAVHSLSVGMLAGSIGLLAVGVIDDVVAFRALPKLLSQIAIVAITLRFVGPFHLAPWSWLNVFLAGFFLLATINAFNLIDGLDGLATGIGIAVAVACGVIALVHNQAPLGCNALAVAGALCGFLLYNASPASIFMGDSGALPLGLILGLLALHCGGLSGNSRLSRYVVPMLLMLVPLLDTAIVSVSRMATGKPISRRGLDHSHHKLLALGLAEPVAVGLFWIVTAATSALAVAVVMIPHAPLLATLPMVAGLFGVIALFMVDLTFDRTSPGVAIAELRGLARAILTFSYKRRMAEALLDFALIPAAYFGAFLIRLDFRINDALMASLLHCVPWVLAVTYAAFMVSGVYRGIWRYASVADLLRLTIGAVLAGAFLVLLSMNIRIELSGSIAVLYVILLANFLVASRFSFRALRRGIALLAVANERVLIVGADELAEAAARYLAVARSRRAKIVGFVDDDAMKLGKLVHGRQVMGSLKDLERILLATNFNELLVAVDSLPREMTLSLWEFANRHHLLVRRFSIRLNDIGPPGESDVLPSSGENRGSTSGQVVA